VNSPRNGNPPNRRDCLDSPPAALAVSDDRASFSIETGKGLRAMTVLMVIGKAALWFAIPLALAGFELYRLKREEQREAEGGED
jgi:hypothetical protein